VARFQILACAALALGAAASAQQAKPISRVDYLKVIDGHFATADTNHDGYLSKAELVAQQGRDVETVRANINKQLTEKFNQLDTNHDGKLSLQEFLANVGTIKSGENADQTLARLDANHDGRISAAEFHDSEAAKFNRVDANHDGVVTPQEQQPAGRK